MNKKHMYIVSAQKIVKPGDTVEIKEVNNMRTFTDEELHVIIEKHTQYLNGELDGKKANLSEANLSEANLRGAKLRGANLSGANLWGANLSEANLSEANLRGANLSEANLWGANLSEANLWGANLWGANLSEANLSEADLRGANLSEANLWGANLSEANLWGANLSEANLSEANLSEANLRGANLNLPMACPSEGSFIGWKKATLEPPDPAPYMHKAFNYFCLIKLEIPADAKRLSGTGKKCRTNKAKVLEIYDIQDETQADLAYSLFDSTFVYRKGETVEVAGFDENRFNECSAGIHFFVSKEAALTYEMF